MHSSGDKNGNPVNQSWFGKGSSARAIAIKYCYWNTKKKKNPTT